MNYQFENTIEELYSCLPNNRNKFNQIMDSMKRRFLKTDITNQIKANSRKTAKNQNKRKPQNLFSHRQSHNSPTKINNINQLFLRKNEQNLNPNIQNNINNFNLRTQRNSYYPLKQEINKNNFSHKRSMSNRFQGTLPDALLMNPKPLRTISKQKVVMDTHANCNNFYPEANIFYGNDIDNVGNGWHNQANNIMFNTKEKFFSGNNQI